MPVDMDTNTALALLQLLVAIAGGIFIAWIWNARKHHLEQYRYLDQAYTDLLRRCFDNPQFCDAKRTGRYRRSYRGENATRYHYFAMTAHTVMESIFDVWQGKIPAEWLPVFEYHTHLHEAWLRDNQPLQEPAYVERVLGSSSAKPKP